MKPLLRTPALFIVFIVCGLGLGSCGKSEPASQAGPIASATPMSALDLAIANYDKTAKDYVRVARQKQTGDVSVTLRYLSLRDQTRAEAKKVQAQTAQMNPAQQKRVALISSRAAPFLTE
ncbi:MAG: hypothetical protein ABI233_06415 [Chthoniobacterales bacterium]